MKKQLLTAVCLVPVIALSACTTAPVSPTPPTQTTAAIAPDTTTTTTTTTTATAATTTVYDNPQFLSTATTDAVQPNTQPTSGLITDMLASVAIRRAVLLQNRDRYTVSPDNTRQIGELTDQTRLTALQQALSGGEWTYFARSEDGWLKCWPVYADCVVLLEREDGWQWVLHLYMSGDRLTNWVAVANMESAQDYVSFVADQFEKCKTGEDRFHRFQVDDAIAAQLARLFA